MIDSENKKFVMRFWAICIGLLLVGLLVGIIIEKLFLFQISFLAPKTLSIRSGQNGLINPLLECDQAQGSFVELTSFKDKTQTLINNLEKDPSIFQVSTYYRDLNDGPWFGINENASFSPASLLKVPLAIAYFKLSESSLPGILQKTLVYNGPDPRWPIIVQNILPEKTLQKGQTYTYEQLIQNMLSYSDNQAYYELFTNINLPDLLNVYNDFNLQLNGPGTEDDSIVSVAGYSKFFRILFNASYLNQTDSNKILSFLVSPEFNSGLVAGVPKGIMVAHKFGEREDDTSTLKQLSDCGVVYYPKHPYLLCTMVKGSDLTKQSNAIAQVSSLVYSSVDSQMNPNR